MQATAEQTVIKLNTENITMIVKWSFHFIVDVTKGQIKYFNFEINIKGCKDI